MDALIVVDLQNDFLPGGALAVPRGDEIIDPVNRLMARFKVRMATQDWHPPNHVSFAASHSGRKPFERILVDGDEQVLWPTHCVQETHGADFPRSLDAAGLTHVVRKGTDPEIDSYSGFFDNGRRKSTDLPERLKEAGVQRLFLCGLALDYCVKFTALDAVQLEYDVFLIHDACRAIASHPADVDRTLAELAAAGVSIITEDSVLAA